MLDERWIKTMHVESMRLADLHEGQEPHVLFQASTVGALIDGAFEGDLTFDELARHGDLGLGTLNHLDGEMIALDGNFYRADVDGGIHPVPPEAKTPFAVVSHFEPTIEQHIDVPLAQIELVDYLDSLVPSDISCAVRLDGHFDLVRARSVPAQQPPYRPLTEVVAEQHVFDLLDVSGTVLGFRFPTYVEGIEIGGFHLHFISEDRSRGGHVLDCRSADVWARVDVSADLHVELPPQVDLADPDLAAATHEAIGRVEGH
ncbi:MAG TPA: acetolactate decarboxylase [Solirubrobacterales bacterium]|jgi:acetolactate decarboxylase|nr:acetolactate decarboxylase [Solirubrobacterales bacterium]